MTLMAADLPLPAGVTITDLQAQVALGVVETYCGWPLEQASYTATLDGDGGAILSLPSLLVTAVTSLSLVGTDPWGNPWPALTYGVDWDWRSNGIVSVLAGGQLACSGWPDRGQSVQVSYSGGYAPLPNAILAVVASVAQRIAVPGTLQSQLTNVGGIQTNRTYSQATTGGAGLTALEAVVADRFRIVDLP